ncbi:hypothetical protein Terro_3933 [Terriglobus roseus DSM 18391]|uniref:DUF885 domain-containing protein n=1 Tax=Terriglobus roseus (strain DSM 18391 / NRRL B-41598 / KBS 63) TaxID=926566 RepID=I3ZLM3_TERRK|nr:DUF885 domain-containing protein [Terriglobus roseus]AFL90141.1 hypothetical protein Terro_3933 [Terriglobus roseus DSM 18391]
MRSSLRSVVVSLALLATLSVPVRAQRISADGATQTFGFVADQYFDDVYFKFNPTSGTTVGYHQYDTQLEDYSAGAIAKQTAALHQYQTKLEAIPADGLDAPVAADREILLNSIKSQLLSLETIRMWQKNPDNYSSGVTGSIFTLMERPYAPVNARLRAAIAREKLIPQVFAEARKNLQNPPKIYTEIALEQIDGNISFFQHDVPLAFADATDAAAKAEFAKTNAAVVEAMKSYAAWMKTDLLPRSGGEFRFGVDTYRKKLLYDEMVDTPLDKLLAVNDANMKANQAEFARIAKDLDSKKTPTEVLAELATIHPAPDKLLDAFRDSFNAEITFIQSHHIITLPSSVRPVLEETPPFERATTSASMDSPGPFETGSTKAYFNVTLPEKDWTPEHVAEHMAQFNVGTIVSTSVHEAFPGHFTQFLWQDKFPSKIRKLTMAATDVEGWAHYCEQMMLDEGFSIPGADERTLKLVRLGQLQDALLRNARFTVAIKMHTEGWTTDQAEQYFVTEGYQSPSVGKVETKRGTSDATYLYYTLGKLEILKLRADVKAKQGARFNLQDFHDTLMRQGPVPIKIVRQAMLHDGSPVL